MICRILLTIASCLLLLANILLAQEQEKNESGGVATDGIANTGDYAEADTEIQGEAAKEPFGVVPANDFGGLPYVAGTRGNMAAGEAPESYKVEEGDTLFDICDQLIDEPDYWPKLWALNPGIKNPHFIFPGMTLKFFPGDISTPPYLQVVVEEDMIPIETGGIVERDLITVDTKDLLQDESSPVPIEIVESGDEPLQESIESDFQALGKIYTPLTNTTLIPAFIFLEELDPLGEVIGGSQAEIMMSEQDTVVLENFENLKPGTTYTIVRPSGEIDSEIADDVGYRYEFVAHVKVIEPTLDSDYVLATVIKSRLGVRPEDEVIAYTSAFRKYDMGIAEISNEAADVSIVGFEFPQQTIGSQGAFVYIDRALPAGGVYPIYQRVDQRAPEFSEISLPDISSKVGAVQIIGKEGGGSLGIITISTYDIRVGDLLGKG